MADEIAYEPTTAGTNAMDYKAHVATYDGFLTLAKWGSGAVIVLLVLMAFFLV